MFGRRWGMRSYIITLDVALVCWHATDIQGYLSNLTKVQRLECVGFRISAPQAAQEVVFLT